MSTRVTSAIAPRKAREKLIRLLVQKDPLTPSAAGTSPSASTSKPRVCDINRHSLRQHKKLTNYGSPTNYDAANQSKRHSYSELRTMYLQKVHDMHPDKMAHRDNHQSANKGMMKNKTNSAKDAHLQFIELKSAWEEYHSSVRIIQRHTGSGSSSNKKYSDDDSWEEGDNFTMFGVGCSFSDSPKERELRDEIMDQACRGWFSSGSLSPAGIRLGRIETSVLRDDASQGSKKVIDKPILKLTDDDMFVSDDQSAKEDSSKKKFLVPNVERFIRRL